jgi:hypothetical protein
MKRNQGLHDPRAVILKIPPIPTKYYRKDLKNRSKLKSRRQNLSSSMEQANKIIRVSMKVLFRSTQNL